MAIEAVRGLKNHASPTKCIIPFHARFRKENISLKSVVAGANGYLLKITGKTEFFLRQFPQWSKVENISAATFPMFLVNNLLSQGQAQQESHPHNPNWK